MSTEKAKPRHRFNVFDAVLILAVIAIALFAWNYLRSNDMNVQSNVFVTYQIELQQVAERIKDSAQVGDMVQDAIRKNPIGKIVAVDVKPFTDALEDMTANRFVRHEVPGIYTIVLTVEADGVMGSNGRVEINGYSLGIGTTMHIHSAHLSSTANCIAMELS